MKTSECILLSTFLLFSGGTPSARRSLPETQASPGAQKEAAPNFKRIDPRIEQIVAAVSEENISSILKRLESFKTRHTLSRTDSETEGIGAARQWIFSTLKSYSPKLQVNFDTYQVKADGRRVFRDVELRNVVAVLPGARQPERQILISGHYDSLSVAEAPPDAPNQDVDAVYAPGVTDDGSGTAAVMEAARILSGYQFDKTLVFVAFAGEEQGLIGSTLLARKARAQGRLIEAVLNNDIIGSDVAGNGYRENMAVRLFSDGPEDSPSRSLARFIHDIGSRYVPAMSVKPVFRADRFGRGGDHTPFAQEGFAAVRFTSTAENYAHQHSPTDTFEHTSPPYVARVVRVNLACLAALASAPAPPRADDPKGPMISRGKSGYDALLRWAQGSEDDLAGYAVVVRDSTDPFWKQEIWVGQVTEFLMPDVSIDLFTFGVKAVDREGHESLVSAYVIPSRPRAGVETK